MKFFFDTADSGYIASAWNKMDGKIDPKAMVGVTTNQNAMSKLSYTTIEQWKSRATELCKLITSIRNDDRGVVYVQAPHSSMSPEDVLAWAKLIQTWGDGKTKIALKIPPYKNILEITGELSKYTDVNVTGVADCSTALRAFSYGVRYVSIIPGRMEEKGIDAKAQIAFASQRKPDHADIIAGSMRTIEGLKWTCAYGTVPTIGTKVWDMLFEQIDMRDFKNFWTPDPQASVDSHFSPHIDARMTDLEVAFFEQMDGLGKPIYDEFMSGR